MGKRLKVELPQGEADRLIATAGDSARDYYEKKGSSLPKLVFVPRTGYHIGPTIARAWGLNGGDTYVAAVSKAEQGGFHYGQMPPADQMKGNDVLIIDGVCKSGETLKHTADWLRLTGAVEVKSLVLMNKPNETTTGYVPDFVGHTDVDGAFYVFPWEMEEYMPPPAEPMFSFPQIGHVNAAGASLVRAHFTINQVMESTRTRISNDA